ISDLQTESKGLEVASSKVVEAVRATIKANAPLVERAQAAIGDTTHWGIVYGGDTTLAGAKYETETIATELGLTGALIYFRQGSFRSVVPVTSRAEAEVMLVKAKERRADAYIVNMSIWCPHVIDQGGYKECANS